MTIIVAIESKDGVTVACDSQVSSGNSKIMMHKSQNKVGFSGPYIIGAAGRLRVGQVLIAAPDLPEPPRKMSDHALNAFMVNDFSKAVQAAMKASGVESIEAHERTLTESEALACVNGRAFTVGIDYSLMRAAPQYPGSLPIAVLGSGTEVALGAHYALMKNDPKAEPREVARIMVEAAIQWDAYCGGKILFFEQSR